MTRSCRSGSPTGSLHESIQLFTVKFFELCREFLIARQLCAKIVTNDLNCLRTGDVAVWADVNGP